MRYCTILAAAAATLLIACGTSTVMPAYSDVIGAYWSRGSAASSAGLEMTLTLNDDFTVAMSSDYLNGQPPIVETGTWLIEGDGTITVRLTETGGVSMYPVIVLVFRLDDNLLKTVSWDMTLYGSEGLSMERI